jgi:bacillithiol biosynthesis deacetylase BshB1
MPLSHARPSFPIAPRPSFAYIHDILITSMKTIELDILAIGAHPDDIELSCGGTVLTSVKRGYKVGILDLTQGEMGTRGSMELRRKEADRAKQILGVALRENLGLKDGNIEVNQETMARLVRVFRKYRPKIILVPHWQERHPDHMHANRLAREALYYSGLAKLETHENSKLQSPWRPHHCFHYMQVYEFQPSFIVDVSDVHQKRREAMLAFASQFYNPKSKEPATTLSQKSFLDMVETRLKSYGQKIGAAYGEPFYSAEPIGIKNVFDLQVMKF